MIRIYFKSPESMGFPDYIDTSEHHTLQEFLSILYRLTSIHPHEYQIFYKGKRLYKMKMTLKDYDIQNESYLGFEWSL
jgi:hypothetical protein